MVWREEGAALLYGLDDMVLRDGRREVWLAESVLDCESLRLAGFPSISFLGAKVGVKWLSFLLGVADSVHVAYDNDDRGRKACEGIRSLAGDRYGDRFVFPEYRGKDPNAALQFGGVGYMREAFGYSGYRERCGV